MIKVLVVEDTATFRAILRHQLMGIGISKILMSADGEEALKVLRREPDVDVILCDWHMHPMDGLTFCSKVQSVPALSGRIIPVLFMTSDPKLADPDKRTRVLGSAKTLSIMEILPKPFNAKELKEAFSRCVGINLS